MADKEQDEARKQAIEKMEEARKRVAARESAEKDKKASDDDKTVSSVEKGFIDQKLDTPSLTKKKKTLKQSLKDMKLDNVKIYSPFKVYFDGEAQSVSGVNGTGPFDVLPGHKNFMSLLKKCDIVVRTKRGSEKIAINHGVMHVRGDQVTVFLDV